jgi:hypothetical protein
MTVPLRIAPLVVLVALVAAEGTAPAAWPTAERYFQAMYNPKDYLRDPRLRGARLHLDKKGQPLHWDGATGSIFAMTTRGGRTIAIRLFHQEDQGTRDTGQLLRRYQKRLSFLEPLRRRGRLPPELMEFILVPEGIEIDEQRLPLMKMRWVHGWTLDEWVGRNVQNGKTQRLAILARNWRRVMRALRMLDIGHGDLHHNNVLVEASGQMRLIDYDSMYVPALDGEPNQEAGHVNYQHPKIFKFTEVPGGEPIVKVVGRTFHRDQDNFSALIIYLSLTALADDPGLWRRYHTEGWNLIFDVRRDFLNPNGSPLLAELMRSRNAEVRGLAFELKRYLLGNADEVPSLERAIVRARESAKPWYQRK